MNNDDICKNIETIINSEGVKCGITQVLKAKHRDLYEEILVKTQFLDKFETENHRISLLERIYCLKKNLKDRPLCKKCHKQYVCNFDVHKDAYKKWCCPSCQASDVEVLEKSKRTRVERYGSETYVNMEKAKRTRYEKNGGKWHSEDFSKKTKETKYRRYGNETYVNAEKGRRTIEENLKNNPNFWKDRDEKSYKTKIANGHDRMWNNRDKFKETVGNFSKEHKAEINNKRERTNIERIGCGYVTQSKEGMRKIRETVREKYGCSSVFQLKSVRISRTRQQRQGSLERIHRQTKYQPMFTDEEFLSSEDDNKTKLWKFKCLRCGNVFESLYSCGQIHDRCPKCEPHKFRVSQSEILDFMRTLGNGMFKDVKMDTYKVLKNRQLDVYSEKQKLAIEYDGLIWHTYERNIRGGRKPKNYHLKKTEDCNSLGIRLIHITEDEWVFNKKLCKGLLREITGTKKYALNAKDSEYSVGFIEQSEGNEFSDKYSFDNSPREDRVYVGLRNGKRLVSMLTLRQTTKNSDVCLTISGYSTLNNFTIKGDLKMMIDFVLSQLKPKTICFPIDRRWYEEKASSLKLLSIGFKFQGYSKPDFWYVKGQQKVSKDSFSRQYFKDNGYKRYFDCGKLIYVMEYS